MYLSIATTCSPATDLGFLLMKHPDRVHEFELPFGRAVVLFPEANEARCEAALVLNVDPVGLVRGRGEGDGLLDQYVNDRPYAVSSLMSVALNRAFRTAMTGKSRERQALAETAIPLEIKVTPLPVRGEDEIVRRMFEPLGWEAAVQRIEGAHGPSRYVELTLRGRMRLSDALGHLYVLIPVLDEEKHYWVGEDEIEKLIARGEAWLAEHPERERIVRLYLKGQRGLARQALARLAPEEAKAEGQPAGHDGREEALEAPLRLHDARLDAVAEALAAAGAKVVADLGCGEGRLIERLARDSRFERVVGIDASARALERAGVRLKKGQPGGQSEGRVILLHGALTYRDDRWHGADAAALVEVIEHLDRDRLPALADAVFGVARPKCVIVTTPNAEYNALFPALAAGSFRHPDHRFEWSRSEFRGWAASVADLYGYRVEHGGIGEPHPELGPVTQIGVFRR